jgi:hypothetical protein
MLPSNTQLTVAVIEVALACLALVGQSALLLSALGFPA